MSELEVPKKEAAGVPAWVMTFADLMTLLMCFFVLLLAFSEMDAARFKQLSGSMKDAFGVQADVEARTIPKGTSIIAQEFSPGKPEPTPANMVRQFTIDSNKNTLDALEEKTARLEEARKQFRRLQGALMREIQEGSVALELKGATIVIRIQERASFASGNADVRTDFLPTLQKISEIIVGSDGNVTIAGHTDDVPIKTSRFRSNWELSSARAVSVTHEILGESPVNEERFVVIGHADTRPLAPNDTPANRAKNRRVDISISREERVVSGDERRLQEALATAAATAAPTSVEDGNDE